MLYASPVLKIEKKGMDMPSRNHKTPMSPINSNLKKSTIIGKRHFLNHICILYYNIRLG
jgi:hypothetical protein